MFHQIQQGIKAASGEWFLSIVFTLCFISGSLAQKDSAIRADNFRVWVKTLDSRPVQFGILFSVKDSSILVSKQIKFDSHTRQPDLQAMQNQVITAGAIDFMLVRKKGNVGKGMAIGAIAGLCSGLLVQLYMLPKENPATQTGLIPVLITGAGIGIGAGLGSVKIKIPIGGSQEQFERRKKELYRYAKIIE